MLAQLHTDEVRTDETATAGDENVCMSRGQEWGRADRVVVIVAELEEIADRERGIASVMGRFQRAYPSSPRIDRVARTREI